MPFPNYEEERAAREMPQFKSFFRVAGLPYELDEYQASTVVSELMRHGAASIVIERLIEDENRFGEPEPAPQIHEPVDAQQLFPADIVLTD